MHSLQIFYNEDRLVIALDGNWAVPITDVSHDYIGYDGMEAIEAAVSRLARQLGIQLPMEQVQSLPQ